MKIPGASDAAITISEHEGIEALQTGGEKAISLRLFAKPAQGSGCWVLSASASGAAKNPHLTLDDQLVRALEQSLRGFRLKQ